MRRPFNTPIGKRKRIFEYRERVSVVFFSPLSEARERFAEQQPVSPSANVLMSCRGEFLGTTIVFKLMKLDISFVFIVEVSRNRSRREFFLLQVMLPSGTTCVVGS